jgi:hypothetical protein
MLPQLIALRPACALFGVALDRKLKNLGRASFAAARASWKESEIQKVDPPPVFSAFASNMASQASRPHQHAGITHCVHRCCSCA